MPFEIPQQEPQVEVSQFEKFAEAMLRGCAVTKPCKDVLINGHLETCALGAACIGFGMAPEQMRSVFIKGDVWGDHEDDMETVDLVYEDRYGCSITDDNDTGRFTREQIAERVRALRCS